VSKIEASEASVRSDLISLTIVTVDLVLGLWDCETQPQRWYHIFLGTGVRLMHDPLRTY